MAAESDSPIKGCASVVRVDFQDGIEIAEVELGEAPGVPS